ncbi:extensin isoform X1 [Nematostella vectensis]|uniref:extensin isoform X1 n=1 Tax=Nematostella vectensis TaxID=45351 RepID=UPI0013902D90|nr:extensin isoform X1 [Nematostella vectensis]
MHSSHITYVKETPRPRKRKPSQKVVEAASLNDETSGGKHANKRPKSNKSKSGDVRTPKPKELQNTVQGEKIRNIMSRRRFPEDDLEVSSVSASASSSTSRPINALQPLEPPSNTPQQLTTPPHQSNTPRPLTPPSRQSNNPRPHTPPSCQSNTPRPITPPPRQSNTTQPPAYPPRQSYALQQTTPLHTSQPLRPTPRRPSDTPQPFTPPPRPFDDLRPLSSTPRQSTTRPKFTPFTHTTTSLVYFILFFASH